MQRLRWEVKKNKKISQPISISTPYGKITVYRNMDYCAFCGKLIGQNDELLGISSDHRVTEDFTEIVAYVAQMIPGFKNAEELLLKLSGIKTSATQIKIMAEEIGEKVFEEQKINANKTYASPEKVMPSILEKDKRDAVLYILMDGSAVNTRVQDKDGSTWKEMKLGLTFLDKDVIKRKNESGIITKKEYVTFLGCVDEFKKLLFDSAVRSGYGKVKEVVIIGDGAHWIWNMCEEVFPDAVYVLDYFHMTENIFNYAKLLYPNNEKKYTKWAKSVIHYIETQQVQKALLKIKNTSNQDQEIKLNLSGYIKNNQDRINYLDYKNKDYYIGSGMIESGNKLVVQKRMKQSGMRWGITGAQYMAALRAKHESGKWKDVENIIFSKKLA